MELLPGIHRIPGVWLTNAYLLVEDHQLTLIDAGLPGNGKTITRYIQSLGREPQELTRIVLTHGHPDHVGPLPRLAQLTNASVLAHPQETSHNPQRRLRRAYRFRPLFTPITADQLIEDSQTLPVLGGLQVLHTPGHTPGSVCLFLPDRGVLFAGDTLLSDGHLFRRALILPGTNFKDYRASVEWLAELNFETALCGHDQPLLKGGTAAVKDMLANYSWLTPRWRSLKRRVRSRLPGLG